MDGYSSVIVTVNSDEAFRKTKEKTWGNILGKVTGILGAYNCPVFCLASFFHKRATKEMVFVRKRQMRHIVKSRTYQKVITGLITPLTCDRFTGPK